MKKGMAQYLVHIKHSVHFNSSHNYFPQAALVCKESSAKAGDAGDQVLMPVLGRIPEERKWQPSLVFLLRKSHGWESLAGL